MVESVDSPEACSCVTCDIRGMSNVLESMALQNLVGRREKRGQLEDGDVIHLSEALNSERRNGREAERGSSSIENGF